MLLQKDFLQTDLSVIKAVGEEKEDENYDFRVFVKGLNEAEVDTIVHRLNAEITPKIDCTACGNCCKTLMINVEESDLVRLANHLEMDVTETKSKFIEESMGKEMIINTIPCHFLKDTVCTIYPYRFTDCREFPHLHKTGFARRSLGTLMHYGSCPIIFNVVEGLKVELGFYW